MQEQIEALLAEHGYEHYETSAFCKPKSQARHNLNYWQFGDYLGLGAGAHSKLSYHDKITRETRHKHPKAFMENAENGNAVDTSWQILQADLGFEFMMNALRLSDGVEVSLFQQRTGLSLQAINKGLKAGYQKGLITQDLKRIKPTSLGQRYLNDLLALFLD
jgi:oxygen-independent coproporphyrinogen-3 oxidase